MHFKNIWYSQQHVYSPTQRSQHTLDLMISKLFDSTSSGIHIHDAVQCVLPLSRPPREMKTIVYKKLRAIDMALATTPANNLSEITDLYNNALRQVLDKRAPEKSKLITIRPVHPGIQRKSLRVRNLEESSNVVGARLNALMITMQYSVDVCSFCYP